MLSGDFRGADVVLNTNERKGKKLAQGKIRIRLKAYDHRLLDQSAKKIVETRIVPTAPQQ